MPIISLLRELHFFMENVVPPKFLISVLFDDSQDFVRVAVVATWSPCRSLLHGPLFIGRLFGNAMFPEELIEGAEDVFFTSLLVVCRSISTRPKGLLRTVQVVAVVRY